MSPRVSSVLTGLILAGVTSWGSPASAVASPKLKLASCDEAPGITVFASAKWRTFWLEAPELLSGEFVPLYACERTKQPVRSLIELRLPYDTSYGLGLVDSIVGDVAAFADTGRYGRTTTYVDLGALTTLQGPSDTWASGTRSGDVLLSSGARLSVGSRLLGDDQGPKEADGDPIEKRWWFGDITVLDAQGSRVIAHGSTFDSRGELQTVAAGPYDVVADSRGARAAVYFRDAQGAPQRVDLSGAAPGLPWTPSGALTRVRRSFKVPLRPSRSAVPVSGTPMQLQQDRRGRLELQRGVWNNGVVAFATLTRLAPGSRREARVISGPAPVVVGRFADRPSERRLRVFDNDSGVAVVDRPAPSLQEERTVDINDVGDVAYRAGTTITILLRQRGAEPSVERTVAGSALARPVLAERALYFTDPSGKLAVLKTR